MSTSTGPAGEAGCARHVAKRNGFRDSAQHLENQNSRSLTWATNFRTKSSARPYSNASSRERHMKRSSSGSYATSTRSGTTVSRLSTRS